MKTKSYNLAQINKRKKKLQKAKTGGFSYLCFKHLEPIYVWRCKVIILILEVLDKHLRVKISDINFEWRFDDSFIIFKFIKTKSQILVSSLDTKNVCKNLVACN